MKFLTPTQLSEYLNVSVKTIYDWVHKGRIPHYKMHKLLRFDINDRWSNDYNGFPISFRPRIGGDNEVFVEWRLASDMVPDFKNERNWEGITKDPDVAPHRENDWSEGGFNWNKP